MYFHNRNGPGGYETPSPIVLPMLPPHLWECTGSVMVLRLRECPLPICNTTSHIYATGSAASLLFTLIHGKTIQMGSVRKWQWNRNQNYFDLILGGKPLILEAYPPWTRTCFWKPGTAPVCIPKKENHRLYLDIYIYHYIPTFRAGWLRPIPIHATTHSCCNLQWLSLLRLCPTTTDDSEVIIPQRAVKIDDQPPSFFGD